MNEPIPMSLSLPTQTYDDNIDEGAADGENSTNLSTIWGRLLSIDKLFPSIDLIDQEYTLGRGKTCTIVFNSSEVQTSKYFLAYSSQHFKIIRDAAKKYVYVVDLSSNGTYINGEKLGKNKQQILENNAEIALASKTHRVYVYIDSNTSEDVSIPAVIRDKYIVSREIGRGAYGEVRLCFNRVGYPPFSESPDTPPLSEQILKGLYTFPDEFWSEISAPAKDLIRQMMCVDPTKRLTITSVLEHPWLANDHDNTARVDKIMYPTLQTMKSMKRAACDEEIDMDQGDETPSADIHANGKNNKRIKY
ncbi:unnamed protein product [Rotaria socialis]|uniref:FHA domain-containing protein n=1 Tax=Rotaria socialis TaxID=392032 RepID=A0A820T8I7_9BILA|nr:unnamed protein product [Rotaria socialis]